MHKSLNGSFQALMAFLLLSFAPHWAEAQFGSSECQKPIGTITPVPLEIEGVYNLKIQAEKILNLKMTLLKNIDSERLSLTFSLVGTNQIILYLSCVELQKVDLVNYKIEASGLNTRGARSFLSIDLNIVDQSIKGELSGNFLRDEYPLQLSGNKMVSIFEVAQNSTGSGCQPSDDFLGTYKGFFGANRPATLNIFKFKKSNGTFGMSGNIISSINILYHDGEFSPNQNLLSLANNYSYTFNGQAKKLMLICEIDNNEFVLRGVHISSSGSLIDNILFRKSK